MANSILIFRIGQLGDSIVALPALWAVRKHFPDSHLGLLCDWHPEKSYVLAADLFAGCGVVDKIEAYPASSSDSKILDRLIQTFRLLKRLRAQRYDSLVYLAPSSRTRAQVQRDFLFFRAAGITQFFGLKGFWNTQFARTPPPLRPVEHEADHLMSRLALSGIPVPTRGQGVMNLNLAHNDEAAVRNWLGELQPDGNRVWVAFGPGSKMPSKKWPRDRYSQIGQELIRKFDVWPVVFGGPEDRQDGERLLEAWGRGYNAAGKLGLRASAFALKRCSFYVGNDTGTMHLAAAAGIRCVAIFSARDWPGRWDPYGPGHKVLRAGIECEGCGLIFCVQRNNECLSRILPHDVLAACEELLFKNADELAKCG